MTNLNPSNALGSHRDTDPELGNPDNKCYCMEVRRRHSGEY